MHVLNTESCSMADASIHFYCALYTRAKDVAYKAILSHSYCSCSCMVPHSMSKEKVK